MNSYLKQATAGQSRGIGPFIDDTDFKTPETGLTIANTDIKLVTNGGGSADKNSGGGTARVNGVYGVTFDATDTGTVGELFVSVVVAGALPVVHTFVVLEEAVYDALFAAAAPGYLQPTTAGRTVDVTATGAVGIDWANVENPTTTLALTNTSISAVDDAPTVQDVVDAVWDEPRSAHTTSGTFGQGSASVQGNVTGSVGSVTGTVGGNVTGSVGSVLGNVLGSTASVVGAVGSVTGAVGSVTGAVGSVTGNVGGSVASVASGGITSASFASSSITAAALAADAVDEIWDEAVDGSVTARQSWRLANSANGAKLSGAATTNVLIRDLADTKNRVDATVDTDGNRTAVTRDLT